MGKQVWKPGNMLYPLPVVLVSCARPGEKPNMLTIAWAATICSDPPMLSVSIRKERYSYDIIEETKEFVVNVTTKQLAYATDLCGVRSGAHMDKFEECGLHPEPSQVVGAPGIKESPVNIECQVVEMKELGSHTLFLAKVVSVSVEEAFMDENGTFHLNEADLITYSHGEYRELGPTIGSFGYSVKKKDIKKPNGRGR